ncbi:putative polyketide synthase [Ilyonectria robusta]|uniref:putative polyketide synthase n=1 Tax=Ilyonectria robusta TaxID=1079257 RepID=UPI001E8D70DC|nr:putative polyketide synthase [Ilyonectria robusta]KAH8694395.1 putative polyketide synthase [Ilyonectria robusta]
MSTTSSADGNDPTSIRGTLPSGDSGSSSPCHGSSRPIEPIAIIGMSCRLPGSASDLTGFWEMLRNGRTAWTPGPGSHFNMKAFQDASGETADSTNVLGAHFLKGDVRAFDASFFGLNALEASAMDPQHRLLLEIAYEAFENAGITIDSLWGSKTGVYVGQWTTDYHEVATRDVLYPPKYLVTGTGPAISSNRISYFFNLHGPSFTLDTGCSSSLVALHQAIHSLRSGEASQCFVGGVNLLLDPQRFVYQSKLSMFSTEGRCFSFDARANGYGRGEGCTGVVLKPLSAALRDNDHIRAVIRNSSVTQDGRTPGLTVPSAAAQIEAIERAYRQASMVPKADYVEAHGTGTKVGDPIEVSAIAAAFQQHNKSAGPLPIGSVKGNIGHTEAAAGLAGLIKSVLMLEKGMIPPQANYKITNPAILLDEWNMRIPTRLEEKRLRRISVNSFGYGGTNAHVIVDEATSMLSTWLLSSPSLDQRLSPVDCKETQRVFFLSAASEKSLQTMCKGLSRYLIAHRRGGNENLLLPRLAHTLGKQSVHPYRMSLVASNIQDLLQQLVVSESSSIPKCQNKGEPRIGFVFSGQGAQYAEMGRHLLIYPRFRQSMEQAREHLGRLGCSWDLLEELSRSGEASRIDEPAISQPSCTAIQLALVDLLAEFGISPCAVVGHSSGEIAATYAVGAVSFDDAMAISYFRGKVTSELLAGESHRLGAMLAVGIAPEIVEEHIARTTAEHGKMRIACFNSPRSVTVSGDATAVDELKNALDSNGYFNRKLKTNGAAYHSHHMEAIEKSYAELLGNLQPMSQEAKSRFFSTVTGKEFSDLSKISTSYWTKNLLSPVLFTQALSQVIEQTFDGQKLDVVLELGPHSQMGGPVKQILKEGPKDHSQIKYMSCLTRGKNAEVALLETLSQLCIQGRLIPLHQLNRYEAHSPPSLLVDLPPYPFDHARTFWHESRVSKNYKNRKYLPHELLGALSPEGNHLEPRWRHFLSLKQSPWLKNHIVQGQIVFPAAGYLTMAIQAIQQHTQAMKPTAQVESVVLRNVNIGKALLLHEDGPNVEIGLSLRPQSTSARDSSPIWSEFRVFSTSPEDKWTEHCRGLVRAITEKEEGHDVILPFRSIQDAGATCSRRVTPSKFYHLSRQVGIDWQQPFDNLSDIRTGNGASMATACATMCPTKSGAGDSLHASLLDSTLFQGYFAYLLLETGLGSPAVPTFIKEMRVVNKPVASGTELVSTAVSNPEDRYTYDIVIQDSGLLEDALIQAQGVSVTKLPGDAPRSFEDVCFAVDWVPYVDSWQPESRDRFCQTRASPVTPLRSSQYLDGIAVRYIQEALSTVKLAEIPDTYKPIVRRLQTWAQSSASSPSPLSKNPEVVDATDLESILVKIGPHLADILAEKVSLLSLITAEDFAQVYNSDESKQCIHHIAEYCHALGSLTPRLKALMVGPAITAGARPIVNAFNGREGRYLSKCDLAGISPGCFETVKEELGNLEDVLELRDWDLGMTEQGLETASYDLIIASHAVKSVESIDSVLSELKGLLKPGAKLILIAVTRETLHYDLLCGLFEAQMFKQEKGQEFQMLSPVIPRELWLVKLKEAGFFDPNVCFESEVADEQSALSVFMAEVPWNSVPDVVPRMDFVTTDRDPSEVMAINHRLSPIMAALPELQVSVHSVTEPSSGHNMAIILPDVARKMCFNPETSCWLSFKNWLLKARIVLFVSNNSTTKGHDNAHRAIWTGLARSIRQEFPHIRFLTMDFEDGDIFTKLSEYLPRLMERTPVFDFTRPAYETENEFIEVDGQLHVSRVKPSQAVTDYICRMHQTSATTMTPFLDRGRTLTAELGIPGLLETIRWKDDLEGSTLGDDELRLELRAASINFKDVLIAAGQLPGITSMRNDCSGVVVEVGANMRHRFKAGDRVLALYSRSYTNYPVVHGDCCETIPEGLSFDEAASVPIVWATVYYSLIDMGRLTKGDKILIHSAAGAVGQAAIMLAQHIGAEIFATVGSQSKRELLHDGFGIPHDHIFSSRTTAFYGRIKDMTGDHGVDVVLNSLSGEMFRHSCNLMAPFGRFVEIGRKELMDDALMPMGFLLKNITFNYVDMAQIIDINKSLARRILHDAVALLAKGSIGPVRLTSMPMSDIEAAFRLIQAGKHHGKIILSVEANQEVMAIPPAPEVAKFQPDATYAVIGGFGGIGRAAIEWMADNGAKHIVSLTRSGAKSQQNLDFVEQIKSKGVNLVAEKCDVTLEAEVALIARRFKEEDGLYPIRGVIQSSVVFEDGLFEQMSAERWWNVLGPKVQGTKNLDNCFREDVDFFIVMSSIISISGNDGQANYAAACCFQDELVRQRVASGLHAFSMNIGPVSNVGWLSERPDVAKEVQRRGFGAISISQVLSMLNYAILHKSDRNGPSSSVCAISPPPYSEDSNEQAKRRETRFAHVVKIRNESHTARAADTNDTLAQLDNAATFEVAVDVISGALLQQLAKLIATPKDMLSADNSLDHYGVDSLIAVEMRNWIVAYLRTDLPLMVLRGTGSIRDLAKLIGKESPLVGLH